MIKKYRSLFGGLHTFLILWITQSFSELGSSMTSFALVIWSYEQKGSALTTAFLSICSYAPYVVLSLFAGALCDRWNKKYTMLVCDSLAAGSTVIIFFLLKTGSLEIWHLYLLNALNGLMNTIQQPASDVAISLIAPKNQYQRVDGLRCFSNALNTILTPVLAAATLAFAGMNVILLFDLCTFGVAFITLAFRIKIPEREKEEQEQKDKESMLHATWSGLRYLSSNRAILDLILFLAAINLVASMYNAALPAMLLSRAGGGEKALGIVNMCTGLASLLGSMIVSFTPAPKSRVRVICNSLLFSMATENIILAFGRNVPVWCIGAVLGWILIPVMGTNMNVLLRSNIPVELQGRVYSVRNTLQFFTIPVGYFLGGLLVDRVFETFMVSQKAGSRWLSLLGSGKGSGAALFFLTIAILGVVVCLVFIRYSRIWDLEDKS
ncbi:MFS transporter [Clostridium sp. E02]|uniref:MFS transporter n=1 Tax=Clostridium sp. E02 TaxID=2487134 RepID=UPI000F525D28|nr:MFS transporter [Clostridium sp. E02]